MHTLFRDIGMHASLGRAIEQIGGNRFWKQLILLLRQHLDAVLATLGERERQVVQLRYGLDDGRPRTLEEIGAVFGVTRERIRQIESKTLVKLRDHAYSAQLRGYLD